MEIEICMGSSCFSRGNDETLRRIEEMRSGIEDSLSVNLKGCLCMDRCSAGPNIRIDGTLYGELNPDCVEDLIRYHLERRQ
ncbi:MAG: NAD(P)H-dependent oxidoreductase subunit E [Fibrobacterota bacterium]